MNFPPNPPGLPQPSGSGPPPGAINPNTSGNYPMNLPPPGLPTNIPGNQIPNSILQSPGIPGIPFQLNNLPGPATNISQGPPGIPFQSNILPGPATNLSQGPPGIPFQSNILPGPATNISQGPPGIPFQSNKLPEPPMGLPQGQPPGILPPPENFAFNPPQIFQNLEPPKLPTFPPNPPVLPNLYNQGSGMNIPPPVFNPVPSLPTGMGLPPPFNQGQPFVPNISMLPPINPSGPGMNIISNQVISISSVGSNSSSIPFQGYFIQQNFNCSASIAAIINSHNLEKEIANKYGGTIQFQGNKFLISGQNQSVVNQMIDELEDQIKKATLNSNVKWAFLENDGSYHDYDEASMKIIEDKYQKIYPELIKSNYTNYSLDVGFNARGASYIVEFAMIGGVHRQKRENTVSDTIRSVKRVAKGEDLNKEFVRNYSWWWRDDDGRFKTYEPDATFLIEQSFIEYTTGKIRDPIVLIQGCNKKTYQLNFASKHQFNEITNWRRDIKREST